MIKVVYNAIADKEGKGEMISQMTSGVVITIDQYRALQPPGALPTPDELFDYEVERLVGKGVMTYQQADPFRKRLPSGLFLPVPPKPKDMDFSDLLHLIEIDGHHGRNFVDTTALVDLTETPSVSYLAVDVEDGAARLGISAKKSRVSILSAGRFTGITYEGIIHCIIFPEVLKHHIIGLADTQYRTTSHPVLWLDGKNPTLCGFWDDIPGSRFGLWSCGGRVSAQS